MKVLGTIGANAVNLEQQDFQAAVAKGNVYSVAAQAGITTQAGLSATTPALTLANPLGSGVKGKLWFAGVTFTVVFAAAAVIWVAVGTDPPGASVTGTLTTAHRRTRLGSLLAQGNKIAALLAATLPAAPVAISILGSGLTGAITTVPQIPILGRWYNGAIEIMPGTNLSIQTSTAGGASAAFCEYTWEEEAL